MRKALLGIGAIVVAITIYNLDAFTGQWKFDKLCKREGGSKYYAQLEPNVGWEVESEDDHEYQAPFGFGQVAFVRFRDKQGATFDVHIKNGPTPWSKAYDIVPADYTKKTRYRLTTEQGLLPEDKRMSRTRFAITDVQLGSPVAIHTYFSYRWSKPERVILSAPTSVTCPAASETNLFFTTIRQAGRK